MEMETSRGRETKLLSAGSAHLASAGGISQYFHINPNMKQGSPVSKKALLRSLCPEDQETSCSEGTSLFP